MAEDPAGVYRLLLSLIFRSFVGSPVVAFGRGVSIEAVWQTRLESVGGPVVAFGRGVSVEAVFSFHGENSASSGWDEGDLKFGSTFSVLSPFGSPNSSVSSNRCFGDFGLFR